MWRGPLSKRSEHVHIPRMGTFACNVRQEWWWRMEKGGRSPYAGRGVLGQENANSGRCGTERSPGALLLACVMLLLSAAPLAGVTSVGAVGTTLEGFADAPLPLELSFPEGGGSVQAGVVDPPTDGTFLDGSLQLRGEPLLAQQDLGWGTNGSALVNGTTEEGAYVDLLAQHGGGGCCSVPSPAVSLRHETQQMVLTLPQDLRDPVLDRTVVVPEGVTLAAGNNSPAYPPIPLTNLGTVHPSISFPAAMLPSRDPTPGDDSSPLVEVVWRSTLTGSLGHDYGCLTWCGAGGNGHGSAPSLPPPLAGQNLGPPSMVDAPYYGDRWVTYPVRDSTGNDGDEIAVAHRDVSTDGPWEFVTNVTTPGDGLRPESHLVVSTNGTLQLFWLEDPGTGCGDCGSQTRVMTATSEDGSAWSASTVLWGEGVVGPLQVARGGDDSIHLAFSYNYCGGGGAGPCSEYGTVTLHSNDAGVTFHQGLDLPGYAYATPRAITASPDPASGTVMFVFATYGGPTSGGALYCYVSRDWAQSPAWDLQSQLLTELPLGENVTAVDLGISAGDHAQVVWAQGPQDGMGLASNRTLWLSTDIVGFFGPAIPIDLTPRPIDALALQLDSGGLGHLLLLEPDSGDPQAQWNLSYLWLGAGAYGWVGDSEILYGLVTDINQVSTDIDLPAGTSSLTLVRTSADGTIWGTWHGVDNGTGDLALGPESEPLEWVQWWVRLNSNGNARPVLQSVSITYTTLATMGTYTTSWEDVDAPGELIGAAIAVDSEEGNATQQWELGVRPTPSGMATWYPIDPLQPWTAVTPLTAAQVALRVKLSIPTFGSGRDSPGPCAFSDPKPAFCYAYDPVVPPQLWGLALTLTTGRWPADVHLALGSQEGTDMQQVAQWDGPLNTTTDADLLPALLELQRRGTPPPYAIVITSSSAGVVVVEGMQLHLNRAPRLVSAAPSPGPVVALEGQGVALRVVATDADGDPLTYRWAFDGTELPSASGPLLVLTALTNATISVSISDGLSVIGATWPLRVLPDGGNLPPVAVPQPLSPVTMVEGQQLQFLANATDPEHGTMTYGWTLDGQQAGSEATFTYHPGLGARGMHTLLATVSDGTHAVPLAWSIEVLPNLPPHIDALHPGSPLRVQTGARLPLSIEASDPEGEALTYLWSFTGNQSAAVEWQAPTTSGRQRVSVTVIDSLGQSAVASWEVSVQPPAPQRSVIPSTTATLTIGAFGIGTVVVFFRRGDRGRSPPPRGTARTAL